MSGTVLLIGAFDVKGEEYNYVNGLIQAQGCRTLTMNVGTLGGTELFTIDIDNAAVAKAGGSDINRINKDRDRGKAMEIMAKGATVLARELYEQGRFQGVFGMGGSGGTSVISRAMRALPVGFPKVIVSTVASGDASLIAGIKDVTMIPSVVDVAGLNPISEKIFKQAAGAISGMVRMDYQSELEQKPVIAISMFGNTTECVNMCRAALTAKGYEVLVFHATGAGGRTMEDLVEEGYVYAVLDITTTEWADEICGGVFSAGPGRLSGPGKVGIPHVIVPGCIDMANFGPIETVPEKYRGRLLYQWNPNVTLMRTNVEENIKIGEIFAQKANEAKGRVAVIFPMRGVSILDSEGEKFWWPEADKAMFETIKKNLKPKIEVIEVDANINDPVFAEKAVEILIGLMSSSNESIMSS